MKAWARLVRLPNALMVGLGVWLGMLCLPKAFDWTFALLGFSSMALLAMAGNIHNDLLDQRTDRVNRPNRPLVNGAITIRAAFLVLLISTAGSLYAAWVWSPHHALLASLMALALRHYNRRWKASPGWGNLAVSLLCALAIYFPEWPQVPDHTLAPMVFAFLTTLIRELMKDAEDMEGDAKAELDTFPLRFGESATRRLCLALLLLLLPLLPLPVFLRQYHWSYLVATIAVILPLVGWELKLLAMPEVPWRKCQQGMKMMMLGGMAAIALGVML